MLHVRSQGDDEEQDDGETTANKIQDSIGGNSASGSYSLSFKCKLVVTILPIKARIPGSYLPCQTKGRMYKYV